MNSDSIKTGLAHVALALRHPEDFAQRWQSGSGRYRPVVWAALFATAVLGTTSYGMTMGLLGDVHSVLSKGVYCTLAAGLAWTIALPALYILNSLCGSRLAASTTILAALVTVSWGGLAMLASVPMNWFFTTAIPAPRFVLLLNLVVFTGVGISMIDVFHRVMRRLEPQRAGVPTWWLCLVGVIGIELFWTFELFDFTIG